jgi:hypothetical protein
VSSETSELVADEVVAETVLARNELEEVLLDSMLVDVCKVLLGDRDAAPVETEDGDCVLKVPVPLIVK